MKTKKIIFDKENEKRPYLAANAVIIKKVGGVRHILLGKRKNVAGAGYWYVPGGHVMEGERLADTLVREIKEETGLDVKAGKQVWLEENFEGGPHHVTLYFKAIMEDEDQEVENREPHKCEEWRWFPVDNPPKKLWVTLGEFLKEPFE